MHHHTKNLADFYTVSAHKRHHTRRRAWPEFEHICVYIDACDKNEIRIIELGCGDGRLYGYLSERYPHRKFHYIGVDVSQGLIDLAVEHYPQASWVCEEMISYLETVPQQSCDIVISIASIQHLPTRSHQQLIFHEMYRVLNYDGCMITVNWSLSYWFIRRYWKEILYSIGYMLVTIGNHSWRNIMVPFTTEGVTYHRFYHIFSHQRLEVLMKLAGFIVADACYINSQGQKTTDRSVSRNHFHVGYKQVRLA